APTEPHTPSLHDALPIFACKNPSQGICNGQVNSCLGGATTCGTATCCPNGACSLCSPSPSGNVCVRALQPSACVASSCDSTTPRSEEHTSELQSLRHLVC